MNLRVGLRQPVLLRGAAVVAIASLAFLVTTMIARGALDDSPPPESEPWPSFTATYRVIEDVTGNTYDGGERIPPSGIWIREFRLEWDKSWEWTKTLVADNHNPDRVGATWHYADMVLTETIPTHAEPQTVAGGPVVPEFWFLKWSQVEAFNNLPSVGSSELYQRSFGHDCSQDRRTVCVDSLGHLPATESVTVDGASEIPLLFEARIAGSTIFKYEVVELELD